MSDLIAFNFAAPAPVRQRRENSINAAAITANGNSFATLSIKGKTFSVVRDGERKLLTRVIDDEEIPVQSLKLVVVRANTKSRVFYAKGFVEGDSDGAKPTCFSHDGQAPDAMSEAPQARACLTCPHAVWGSKISPDGTGKGTACTVNTRLAVIDPRDEKMPPYLLRVPAASRASFNEAVKQVDSHGKDYNEVVMRISFDPAAATPKLVFKPTDILGDAIFDKVSALYDDAVIKDITGVATVRDVELALPAPAPLAALPAAAPAPRAKMPVIDEDDLYSALAGTPAPAPAPAPRTRAPVASTELEDALAAADAVPAPAPAPRARKPTAAAPAPAPVYDEDDDMGAMLGDLNNMLKQTDD
jgi:hypothetical protein